MANRIAPKHLLIGVLITLAALVAPYTASADPASDLAEAETRQSELLALKADAKNDLAAASRLGS